MSPALLMRKRGVKRTAFRSLLRWGLVLEISEGHFEGHIYTWIWKKNRSIDQAQTYEMLCCTCNYEMKNKKVPHFLNNYKIQLKHSRNWNEIDTPKYLFIMTI
jgi:hypothetical protein